ncbi:MAG: hypothetical protein QME81_06875 [bacterium]|nr:hypothetical protein [bacterium]
MAISDQRKDELSIEARNLAAKLSTKLSSPDSKTGGESELRAAVNFFIKKKNVDNFKQLLSGTPPKRSEKTLKYWEAIKSNLISYLDDAKYSPEELVYLFAWASRLLKRY